MCIQGQAEGSVAANKLLSHILCYSWNNKSVKLYVNGTEIQNVAFPHRKYSHILNSFNTLFFLANVETETDTTSIGCHLNMCF